MIKTWQISFAGRFFISNENFHGGNAEKTNELVTGLL